MVGVRILHAAPTRPCTRRALRRRPSTARPHPAQKTRAKQENRPGLRLARGVCSGGRSRTANHLLVLGLRATFRQHLLRTTSGPSGTCRLASNPRQYDPFHSSLKVPLSCQQFGEDHIVPSDQQRRRRPGEEQHTPQQRRQPGGAVLQPSGEQPRPQPSPAPNTVAFTLTHPHLCATAPQERHGNAPNNQAEVVLRTNKQCE